jgi:glyoxylase I family protein
MPAIKTLGLDHVVLRVQDIPRACAWYAAVLGCKVERVLPSLGLTQLRAGTSLIDWVDVNGPAGKPGGAAPGSMRRNMDHYCMQLAEFSEQKIVAHLKRKGITPGKVGRRYGALGHGPSMYLTDRERIAVPSLKCPLTTNRFTCFTYRARTFISAQRTTSIASVVFISSSRTASDRQSLTLDITELHRVFVGCVSPTYAC